MLICLLLLTNVGNSHNISVENLHFQDSQIISSKEQHIEIEIYCNIINVYTDTFDQ